MTTTTTQLDRLIELVNNLGESLQVYADRTVTADPVEVYIDELYNDAYELHFRLTSLLTAGKLDIH